MPPLYHKQEFPSLRAFKEALYAWAIESHFEPRILKSDSCRVRVGCKTDPNCPFIIRCNFDTERKKRPNPVAVITVLRNEHTCENDGSGRVPANLHQNGHMDLNGTRRVDSSEKPRGKFINRSTASRLPFLLDNVPRLMNVTSETKPVDIRDAIMKEYGYELHLQQCRRAKTEILKAVAEQAEQAENNMNGVNVSNNSMSNNSMSNNSLSNNSLSNNSLSNSASHQPFGHSDNRMLTSNGSVDPALTEQLNTPARQVPNVSTAPMTSSTPMRDLRDTRPRLPVPNEVFGESAFGPSPTQQESAADQSSLFADMSATEASAFNLHTPVTRETPVTSRGGMPTTVTGEAPQRCPYCINQRWLRSIKDAVDHISMHVVV